MEAAIRIASYLFAAMISFAALYHLASAPLPGECGAPAGDAVRVARAADAATLAVAVAAAASRALARYLARGPDLLVYVAYLAAASSTRLLEALRPAAAALTAADAARRIVLADMVVLVAVFAEAGTRLAIEVIDIMNARKIKILKARAGSA